MARTKASHVSEKPIETTTSPQDVAFDPTQGASIQPVDANTDAALATYGISAEGQINTQIPVNGYAPYNVSAQSAYNPANPSVANTGLTNTIGSMGTVVPDTPAATADAIAISYTDKNGNEVKQYLTAPQIAAIRNFAKNTRDVSEQTGFKLKITKNNSDDPSDKYYNSSFWGSNYSRNGDENETPLTFDKTAYTLSESQYEAALESIKELDKKRGIVDHELMNASQKIKPTDKPFLVKTGDFIQKNLFDTIGDMMPIGFLGTIIKMTGNVLTGLLKTLGYTFSGDFSKAGSEGLSWLKDTAIIGGGAIGVYQLGKKMEWWGQKKENTSTNTSTNNSTSNGSSGNAGNTTVDSNITTTVSVKHTASNNQLNTNTDAATQNLQNTLKKNATIRSENNDGTVLNVQIQKTNS